jgi:UPF0755 protein
MRRFVGVLLILIVLAMAAWLAASYYLPYQGFPSGGVYVDVQRGASLRAIARLLSEQGVIRSRIVFELIARNHPRRTLQAGEYFFDHPQKPVEVFWQVAEGRVFTVGVTVPEGLTMFEAADLFERTGLVTRVAFLAAARDAGAIRDLAPGARTLEGFLFPATYQFPRHITAEEITAAMVRRFREVWRTVDIPQPSGEPRAVLPIVTLASLVERETPVADERPLIAGVFTNRLRRHMVLDCDPTVVYALEAAGRYRGHLEARDLGIDSPYNTYRHAGLPPGPIASPGERSLRAALEPAETEYLYFVANTQGGHFFSKTLAEHSQNVAKYHRLLQQQSGEAGSDDRPAAPPKKPGAKRSSRRGANAAR